MLRRDRSRRWNSEKGLLILYKKQQSLDVEAHVAAHARELGIPAEVLDAKATAAVEVRAPATIVAEALLLQLQRHL